MSDSRLDKGLGKTSLTLVWNKMKAYVNSFMSTVDSKISSTLTTKFPTIYTVTLAAFTTSAPYYKDITITFENNMENTDYVIVVSLDSLNVSKSTYKHIGYQPITKTTTSCTLRFWNENQADINATKWNIMIFPK